MMKWLLLAFALLFASPAAAQSAVCPNQGGASVAFAQSSACALRSCPELTTNGNFALNPVNAAQNTIQNGWEWRLTPGSGTASVVYNSGPQTVTITGDGTNTAQFTQSLSTISGITYNLYVDISVNAISTVGVGTTAYAHDLLNVLGPVGVRQNFQFTATGSTSWLTFGKGSAASATVANVLVHCS